MIAYAEEKRAEGMIVGEIRRARVIAQELFCSDLSLEEITKYTRLPLEEVKYLHSITMMSSKEIKPALAKALADGDSASFIELLRGYVLTHDILDACSQAELDHAIIYNAIRDGNVALDALCKIMKVFS